jgi:D-arabinose 1-dehydrogenase-like Zn-dependent alcohol dehydrogenase
MKPIRALAAKDVQSKLEPFEYTLGPLNDDQVDIEVQYCGLCHSDLSMLKNEAYLALLAPKVSLHFVGAVPKPISVGAFSLIGGQKTVFGSPLGSPATTRAMIDFCTRHQIAPMIERFPMSKANEAFEHLEAGKARYRIVLENDL